MGTAEVIAQIGVGFVGGAATGFVAPLIIQTKDRRAARSVTVERIAELESARWSNGSYDSFSQAIGSFRAAAIGARVPKSWVDEYIGQCRTIYGIRRQSMPENMPRDQHENLLDAIDNRAAEVADALVTVLWYPFRARFYFLTGRLRAFRRVKAARSKLDRSWGYTDPLLDKTLRAWERRLSVLGSEILQPQPDS
jgi:hypothetical protein